MGTWFWLNFPLALLFFCCWAGIPLWLTLSRWSAELDAKHAEVAAAAAAAAAVAPVAQPTPVGAEKAVSPAYAAVV